MPRKTILCMQCRFADGCPYTKSPIPAGELARKRRDCIGGRRGGPRRRRRRPCGSWG